MSSPDIEKRARILAERLHAAMPEGWGYSLFVFKFDEQEFLHFMNITDRREQLRLLTNLLASLQASVDDNSNGT